jgi:hypothetical protein
MDLLLVVLILLVVFTFGGWGYGSYHRGAYASPMGLLGAVLLVALLLFLFTGWRPYATLP